MWSGTSPHWPLPATHCPECGNEMFAAFNCVASAVPEHVAWPRPSLHVMVCMCCSHFMDPYLLTHGDDALVVEAGNSDAQLYGDCFPDDTGRSFVFGADGFTNHQIGGNPSVSTEASVCSCGAAMNNVGTVDSDPKLDLLLDEDGDVCVFEIADAHALNFYACSTCAVVGVVWAK